MASGASVMNQARQAEPEVWIEGWKAAGKRIGRSGETVRYWHWRYGIPGVYRLGNGSRGRILIDQAQFDAWWRAWRHALNVSRAT